MTFRIKKVLLIHKYIVQACKALEERRYEVAETAVTFALKHCKELQRADTSHNYTAQVEQLTAITSYLNTVHWRDHV